MAENKQLVNGKWVNTESLPFYYPMWVEKFPVKIVRRILKRWYWKYGE